jgi:hypothetical protein
MPIVTKCNFPGCETLTIGSLCIVHETCEQRVFVRGRPWEGTAALSRSQVVSLDSVRELRRASVRVAAAPTRR